VNGIANLTTKNDGKVKSKRKGRVTMKKLIALGLGLAMILSLATACGSSSNSTTDEASPAASEAAETTATDQEASTEAGASVVKIGISADPGSLNPWINPTEGGRSVAETLYETLGVISTVGGEIEPCLMSSYEWVDDVTLDVTLFDYIHDTEGNPFKASDVVFCYETAKEMGYKNTLAYLDSVTALDDTTVEFVFTDSGINSTVDEILTDVYMTTEAAYTASDTEFADWAVGTTGYRLTDYTVGSSLTFDVTGDYWQTDETLRSTWAKTNVDEIQFKVITESTQIGIALESGDIDMSGFVSSKDLSRFEDTDGYNVFSNLSTKGDFLLYCGYSPYTSNVLVRQAIAYAINVDDIIQGVYSGRAAALYSVGNWSFPDCNPDWDDGTYYPYDPAKAKELLTEAGYGDGLDLKLICINASEFETEAQIIQAELEEVGINLTIESYEQGLFMEYAHGGEYDWDIQLDASGSTDYITSIWKRNFDADSNGGMTSNFFVDQEFFDALALALTDEGHTQENVDKVHEILKEQLYAYGLCSTYSYIVSDSTVTDVVHNARNYVVPGACEYAF
jgi:ABC-type transport system substrate-binding protein